MLIFRVQISKIACLKTKPVRPRRRRGPGPKSGPWPCGPSPGPSKNTFFLWIWHLTARNQEPRAPSGAESRAGAILGSGFASNPQKWPEKFGDLGRAGSGFSGFSRNAPNRPRMAPNRPQTPQIPQNSHYLGVPGPGLFFPFRANFSCGHINSCRMVFDGCWSTVQMLIHV